MDIGLCLGLISFLIRGLRLCIRKKHVLTMLVSLEAIFLGIFCEVSCLFSLSDPFYLVLLLVIGICEAVVALAAVVFMVRSNGNDHVLRIRMFKC